VKCRGYSEALQRALTDFGADDAFARAAAKLKEHYGIEVAVSAIRGFTEEHGAAMRSREKQKSDWRDQAVQSTFARPVIPQGWQADPSLSLPNPLQGEQNTN
jgi:hypothetical protein